MTTFFHLTDDQGWAAISAHGLVPAIGPRSAELGESAPRIYLFPTMEDLENALGNWLGECFSEDETLHVLTVDVEGLAVEHEVEWEAIVSDPIPVERISYLRAE